MNKVFNKTTFIIKKKSKTNRPSAIWTCTRKVSDHLIDFSSIDLFTRSKQKTFVWTPINVMLFLYFIVLSEIEIHTLKISSVYLLRFMRYNLLIDRRTDSKVLAIGSLCEQNPKKALQKFDEHCDNKSFTKIRTLMPEALFWRVI